MAELPAFAARYPRRRRVDHLARAACALAAAVAVVPLVAVVAFVARRGLPAMSWTLLTRVPGPVGDPGGGIANALAGSAVLVAAAAGIGFPCAVLTGFYLADPRGGRLAATLRYAVDVIASVPSIVLGIVVYAAVVVPMRRFSALAGAIALALVMLPIVTRTTEEMIRLVPDSLREAGLALGVPRWRILVRVVLRTALPGILTGGLLAVARAAGETAPLLFTALGNQHFSAGLREPIASLPVQIYAYAISPYEIWHQQAWAAALVLLLFVLALNVAARLMARGPR